MINAVRLKHIKKRSSILIIIILFILFVVLSLFGWRNSTRKEFIFSIQDNELVNRVKKHVYRLSHEIGTRNVEDYANLKKAEQYIDEEFKTYGYAPIYQEYMADEVKVKNIIVIKEGIKHPDEVIVIGAHYDSCFNPGADDNASAVAGLLELARVFSKKNINRTIKFIAFVNEEPPYFKTKLMGSLIYAQEARKKNENIKTAIILEMIGYFSDKKHSQHYPPFLGFIYPNKGNFIILVGNSGSSGNVKTFQAEFKKFSSFPIETIALDFIPFNDLSDHWAFWQNNYPAFMITDTAFLRNPHYHKQTDTYEKLDYQSMAHLVETFSSVIQVMAQ